MTIDVTAASLTRRFTGLLSAWPAHDPALLDRCRLLLLDGLAAAVAGAAECRPGLMAAQARSESNGPSTAIGQGFTPALSTLQLNGVGKDPRDDHSVLGRSKTAAIERAIVTAEDFPVRPLMAMLA